MRLRADRIGALRDDLFLAAETDLAAVLGHVDAVKPDAAGRRLGADRRQRRGRRVAGQRQPGPRGRGGADPGRQGARHRDRAGRPRHQGRLDRRAAAARAPRRRRPALRGRPALPAAHGARRQEPLRPGRRGRLLRPVRRRHRGAGRPERAVPVPAARGGAGHLRHGHRRGQAAAGRRGAGAGGALDAEHPRAVRRAGSTAAGVAMVLAVLQRRAQVNVGTADVYASTVGGVRLTEPATDLAVALAVAGAAQQRPARHRPGRDRRGRPGRRDPPGHRHRRAGSPRRPGSASPTRWCRRTRARCRRASRPSRCATSGTRCGSRSPVPRSSRSPAGGAD